ncbi:MAG: DUF86 domain-containing protein [Acidimicrobiales bacterium]|nr:DUF86 domain-containing protein [Acidimicrobiales bacterium]
MRDRSGARRARSTRPGGRARAWLALERIVEIAGEAASQIDDETRAAHPRVAWRELAATRTILAHAYHRVDRGLLWDIAERDLPQVAEALGHPRPTTARTTMAPRDLASELVIEWTAVVGRSRR